MILPFETTLSSIVTIEDVGSKSTAVRFSISSLWVLSCFPYIEDCFLSLSRYATNNSSDLLNHRSCPGYTKMHWRWTGFRSYAVPYWINRDTAFSIREIVILLYGTFTQWSVHFHYWLLEALLSFPSRTACAIYIIRFFRESLQISICN